MDTAAGKKQPSNLSLAATAVLCGVTVAWAYQDRVARTGQVFSAETSMPAGTNLPAPAEPPPQLIVAPKLAPPARVEPPSSPWLASRPQADWGWPTRLPPPPEPTPAVEPGPIASEGNPPLAIAAPETGSKPLYADELSPEDFRVEERSVLSVEPYDDAGEEAEDPVPEDPVSEDPLPVLTDNAITPVFDDPAVQALVDADPNELLTYTPAGTEISQRVAPDVRAAFSLGRHGALYAARGRFIEVMRRIAASKDGQASTTAHSDALAEGLAALEEAQDFLSLGSVSSEMSVAETAASHRTALARIASQKREVLPQEAAALYYRYAEQKLASAVQGEQAGSMALYGLGKTHAQLHRIDGDALDQQKAQAMYRAAVLAHHANHLAANELGVGLACGGHYRQAAEQLERSITYGGGSTVYHNLAHVQHKLGQNRLAAETSQRAERLAMQERAAGVFSRERGVQWVLYIKAVAQRR